MDYHNLRPSSSSSGADDVDDNDDDEHDVVLHYLPTLVIVEQILPFLDRPTWNACAMVCRDIYETSRRGLVPLWPAIRFAQDGVKALALSPDGMCLAVGVFFPKGNAQILLYNVRRGLMQRLQTGRYQLDLLEWPNQNYLICTSDFENVQIWDMKKDSRSSSNCNERIINTWNMQAFRSIAADDARVAIGHCTGQITVWSILQQQGAPLFTLEGEHFAVVKSLRFLSNKNRLVSVCDRDTVCVWDLRGSAGNCHSSSEEDRGNDFVNRQVCELNTYALPVGIAPAGTHVAIASVDASIIHTAHASHVVEDISVWLWKLNEDGEVEDAPLYFSHFDKGGHSLQVTFICFSADGARMATCSFDRSIRIWDLYTGKCEKVLEGHQHHSLMAYFTADGKTLVSKSYGEFRIWDIR